MEEPKKELIFLSPIERENYLLFHKTAYIDAFVKPYVKIMEELLKY